MASPDSPVYLVLGATGGIGSALSRRLADAGATVVLGARSTDRLMSLASEIDGHAIPLDATRYEEVEAAVNDTRSRYGRLDGLANCVGSILLKPAHLTSVEAFHETLALNLHTAFYAVKAGARAMMNSGGAIVLCSSAVARTGLVNHDAIAAAKAGVEGLTRAAAATYARRNIRINAVAPGLVETPLSAQILSSDVGRRQSEAMHALGRLGRPEDVARVLHWLLDTEQSGWVTGQVVGVDGGLSTLRPR